MTRTELRMAVLDRLGDTAEQVWTGAEVEEYLDQGYALIAELGVFVDWIYAENLPGGSSYSQPWERALLERFPGGFLYGPGGTYSYADERRLLTPAIGPSNHSAPWEATSGALGRSGADTSIPATAELPETVIGIHRGVADGATIEGLTVRDAEADAQYETTTGPVIGFLWQKDGVRTLRKVRVPADLATTWTITGSWGSLRRPTDLSTATVTGSWGVPRRIPGQHPMGAESFGLPRRPYRDETNVRLDVTRYGRDWRGVGVACELPDRYAVYLRDYAQGQCLGRRGPGQQPTLATHFLQRWERGLARIRRRLASVEPDRVIVFGGQRSSRGQKPPRPQLPWQFGRPGL